MFPPNAICVFAIILTNAGKALLTECSTLLNILKKYNCSVHGSKTMS